MKPIGRESGRQISPADRQGGFGRAAEGVTTARDRLKTGVEHVLVRASDRVDRARTTARQVGAEVALVGVVLPIVATRLSQEIRLPWNRPAPEPTQRGQHTRAADAEPATSTSKNENRRKVLQRILDDSDNNKARAAWATKQLKKLD